MNAPILTANVSTMIFVNQRFELSVTRTLRVNVKAYAALYQHHAELYSVWYSDLMGRPLAEHDEYTGPFDSPEDALLSGIHNVLANAQAVMRERIEDEQLS